MRPGFRIVSTLLLLLLVAGCGRTLPIGWTGSYRFVTEPAPVFRHNDGIRVATLNTEFMFDGEDDEGEADFAHKGDSLLSRLHRAAIARTLQMIDADVVMLQEVENERAVRKMLQENEMDSYTIHFIEGLDSFTGQDVALISRIPVDTLGRTDESLPRRPGDRLQQVSKNMFVRLDLGGLPVTIIGVHFLARPGDPARKPRRELQAEIIRRLAVREAALGRSLIILGDFNDFDSSTPDLIGSKPITDVMSRIKSVGPDPADDLRNLLGEVPQEKRFTAHWDRNDNGRVELNELSAIDHILVSNEIYSRVREVKFVHSHNPVRVTDHFPIVFSIATN